MSSDHSVRPPRRERGALPANPEKVRTSIHRAPVRVLFAVVAPLQAFFRLQSAGGLLIMASAAIALALANSRFRTLYDAVFHATIEVKVAERGMEWTVHHFTNDALMTLFFVVAGLEIKRELTVGELRTWGRAALPLVAALGGMVVPALLYLAVNRSGAGRAGWGVPMATDIAFALGCLSLLRGRVPPSLFVFLMALAIFDDLGAILVIALFYGGTLEARFLGLALLLTGLLVLLGRLRVQQVWPYALVGGLLWLAVLESGLHATVAGVIIGLSMPTKPRREARDVVDDLDVAIASLRRDCERRGVAPDGAVAAIERHLESVQPALDRAAHGLRGIVAFGVVPLFALANAGVTVSAGEGISRPVALGVVAGLCLGKPIGVFGATWIAVRLGLAPRPTDASWAQVLGAAIMAGVGFTMSLFVGNLAFGRARALEDSVKLGVLAASLVSAVVGLVLLRIVSKKVKDESEDDVPVLLDVPRFARGYSVRPCSVGPSLQGKTVGEAEVRRRFGVTIIGAWRAAATDRREHESVRGLETVSADTRMEEGDVLLVAGEDAALEKFLEDGGTRESSAGELVDNRR